MRFYLIGAGFINRTHMKSLEKLGLSETSSIRVCDANPQTLEEFVSLYPDATPYSNAEEMLAEQPAKDDVVIVGTPPASHYPLAMLGLSSGRHVLCEKPLVIHAGDAERLLEEAKRRGVTIGCCSSRFSGLAQAARAHELIGQGSIGKPYKLSFIHRNNRNRPGIEYQPHSRWFLDRSKAGGGILLDWGPYDVASMVELLDPVRVEIHSAWLSQPSTSVDPADVVNNVETHCGVMMKFVLGDGTDVRIHYERASCTHGEAYNHVELEGTHGAIAWDTFYGGDKITLATDVNGEISQQVLPIQESNDFGPMDNPLRWFIAYLRDGSGGAIVDEQAVFNIRCIQAIYACAETGESQVLERVNGHDQ